MDDDDRTRTQDRFASGEIDVVVATVAFGMGIDRADIRYVLHAAMPKSIEHYQQETGRAGRDGKPAECVLFFAGQDYQLWNSILSKNETTDLETKRRMLSQMYSFATGTRCRHRRLVEYFGQPWTQGPCGACDVCLGEFAAVPDSTVLAQKILSCVARTHERFGPAYVADVLRGDPSDRIRDHGHDRLPTFGLLAEEAKPALIEWMHQLVDQDLLAPEGDYGILRITDKGRRVMRSESEVSLLPVKTGGSASRSSRKRRKVQRPRTAEPELERLGTGDQPLFEELRDLRRELADRRNLPAYMIFSDRALRGMARQRPTTPTAFLQIHGVGMTKLEQFGERFMDLIRRRTRRG
jgi:ATP-dependent DNA helicase RecQ